MGVAKLLDVEHSRIRINFAGLNHMVYGLDVFLDGDECKGSSYRFNYRS